MGQTYFPDPPTQSSLFNARHCLQESLQDLDLLKCKIANAEAALQKTILEAQCAIDDLQKEKFALEDQVSRTRFYLAPVRTLPLEILRDIFHLCFEDDHCVGWILAGVCKSWRGLALAMPKIWSKIRLRAMHGSSPDTVRLWVERSGLTVPLDIEILIRGTKAATFSNPSRPIRGIFPPYLPPTPIHSPPILIGTGSTYHSYSSIASLSPFDASPRSFVDDESDYDHEQGVTAASRNRMHWAHIAFSYLVEQMHRWERFVFRFDTHFPSIGALKTIFGDAPLLKEFEISSASEAMYTSDWSWLPNLEVPEGKTGPIFALPKLRSVTLQLTPFRSTSPLFHTGLHTLNLYSLSNAPASLDRLLHVLRVNRASLQRVSFHFREVSRAIIPLSSLTLLELKELSLGGHQVLSELVDALTLPSLEELNLDLYGQALQQTISTLVARSGGPAIPIKHLSIGYGFGCGHTAAKLNRFVPHHVDLFGGRSSHFLGGWRTVLEEMTLLESLRVGDDSSNHLLETLTPPEGHNNTLPHMPPMPPLLSATLVINWVCPNLVELGIKGYNLQAISAAELVRMVEMRNPSGGGTGTVINGVTPKRLKVLELYECSNVRQEVKEWFQSKVEEVAVTEPFHMRMHGSLQHNFA